MLAAILALVAQLAPLLGDAAQIASVISTLETIIATATAEVKAVLPMIKNIITALQSNGNVTADQLAALKALDAATDADFEAAASDDGAAADPSAQTS